MNFPVGTSGPRDAKIMIVGEAPGKEETRQGFPFVGVSGMELSRMLSEVGIARNECFITNVCKYQPPHNLRGPDIELWWTSKKKFAAEKGFVNVQDGFFFHDYVAAGIAELNADIEQIKPNVIIALGNLALWALTGETGITKWAGSVIWSDKYQCKICPTIHPAAIIRQWEHRSFVVHDLKRFKKEVDHAGYNKPKWQFVVRPDYATASSRLDSLLNALDESPTKISVDIETRAGHIECVGLAWSKLDAICIPFMCVENPLGYWKLEQEFELVCRIRKILTHPNARIIGQNFLYDVQYFAKYWGVVPENVFDTMLAHHVCFLGTNKGLDFLSRLYCDFHCYWKDDGKEWDKNQDDEQRWTYNCRDAVVTYEVAEALEQTVDETNQREQFNFIMSLFHPVLRMMLRGVKFDLQVKAQLIGELLEHIAKREQIIEKIAGKPLNPKSPKQLQDFFYGELNLPVQWSKQKRPTTDDEALVKLATAEPLVSKICYAINECRSLYNSLSVVNTKLDSDGRIRCSYNIGGTETTRFSSSTNAFGSGTNLQNITKGKTSEHTGLELPNLRRLFIPDIGFVFADVDLDRADAQVVAWEADDSDLKQIFREGLDLHLENAKAIFGSHIQKKSPERALAKAFCHAANYGATPPTLARALGITVKHADQIHKQWFAAHPNILEWHRSIEAQLAETRQVKNAFGFRRLYFDRIEQCFTQALAWIPQSTVAIVINKGLVALDKHMSDELQLLLQVHDSLGFQVPSYKRHEVLEKARPHLLITVPYPDPLIIPIGFATSDVSWGGCE